MGLSQLLYMILIMVLVLFSVSKPVNTFNSKLKGDNFKTNK